MSGFGPTVSEESATAPVRPEPARVSSTAGTVLVAVQGRGDRALEAAREVESRLGRRFPANRAVVLVTAIRDGASVLQPLAGDRTPEPSRRDAAVLVPAASQGAVPARTSPIGGLLQSAVEHDAAAVAVIAAEPHDAGVDWLDLLLSPIVSGDFELVCPAYVRYRTEGAINTGIVSPLVRTLYGKALRQPLGTEVALSGRLARKLLADEDWLRRPEDAGSDAWLLAKVLDGGARVAQSWLGAWPRPTGEPEEPSETLVRSLGLVFSEMERTAARWQRTGPSGPVPTFGASGFRTGGAHPDPARLEEAFVAGLRDLHPILGLVLTPATMLELERAATSRGGRRIPDAIWAHVIFDFAVAHLVRAVERRQLLRSLTPLYLGWLGGLARDAEQLEDAAFDARLEAIGASFEREKRYLVARWRWPDEFNP